MCAFSHTTARIFTNSRFVENKDTVRRHFLRKRKEKKENEIMREREREREREMNENNVEIKNVKKR